MEMVSVSSSMITEIGHDAATLQMRVTFKGSGQTWEYDNVPRSVYNRFISGASQGKFFNQEIKGQYTGRQV